MLDFSKSFTDGGSKWTFAQYGSQVILRRDIHFWNRSEVRGQTIIFFRDVGEGFQERVEITPEDNGTATALIRTNTEPGNYNDWELEHMIPLTPVPLEQSNAPKLTDAESKLKAQR